MPEESKLVQKLEESQKEAKFSEEDLKQVQEIQKSYMNIQNSFGQIKMARLRLDQQELDLGNTLKEIQNKEKKFLDGITEKYGEGSLNPETGVFTPNNLNNSKKYFRLDL